MRVGNEWVKMVRSAASKKMYAYVCGNYVPLTSAEEGDFLQGAARRVMKHERHVHANSGRVSEWVVQDMVQRQRGLTYQAHVRLPCGDGSFICADGFIPELDLYVEVKGRAYHTHGSISEKLDSIPRKFARVNGPPRQCIVVLSAHQATERNGLELLSASTPYAQDFRALACKYGIIDWVSCAKLSECLDALQQQKAGLKRKVARVAARSRPARKAGTKRKPMKYMTRQATKLIRRSARVASRKQS